MTRVLAVMLSSLVLAAAGPHVPAPARMPLLPLPPPLPVNPPTDEAAPVPDGDLIVPGRFAPGETSFALRTYPLREFGTSDGFIPGSAYQSPEQRKPMQTPGFMFTVPLQ